MKVTAREGIVESLIRLGEGELATSLDDGVTRAARDPENALHRTVPNRMLQEARDLCVREARAGRDAITCVELHALLLCPIEHKPMRRPFVDQFGHYYNARALKKWVDLRGQRAPMAGASYDASCAPGIEDPLARELVRAIRARYAPIYAPQPKEMDRDSRRGVDPGPASSRQGPPCAQPCSASDVVCALSAFGISLACTGSGLLAAILGVGIGAGAGTARQQEARDCLAGQLRSTAEVLERMVL